MLKNSKNFLNLKKNNYRKTLKTFARSKDEETLLTDQLNLNRFMIKKNTDTLPEIKKLLCGYI